MYLCFISAFWKDSTAFLVPPCRSLSMQNWGADMFISFVNPFPSPGGSGGSNHPCCCCFTRWPCARGWVINTRYISNVPAGQEWLTYLIVAFLKGHKLGPDFDLGHELQLCDPSGCVGMCRGAARTSRAGAEHHYQLPSPEPPPALLLTPRVISSIFC